jgi:hypothetical protein
VPVKGIKVADCRSRSRKVADRSQEMWPIADIDIFCEKWPLADIDIFCEKMAIATKNVRQIFEKVAEGAVIC